MKLTVKRYKSNSDATIGRLFIDGNFECYTVEDEKRTVKKYGETRIPEGLYKIGLRKAGSFHTRYSSKFPEIHEGMLCLYNEPDWKVVNAGMTFQFILIHIGNTDDDTAGCILVNSNVDENRLTGSGSTTAYKKMYPKVAKALLQGKEVSIEISDLSGAAPSEARESNPEQLTLPARGFFKRGDKGPEIIEIQKLLHLHGCWKSTVSYNSNFGPITEEAVKQFQSDMQLTVDGLVGKGTLNALKEKKSTKSVAMTIQLPPRGYFQRNDKSQEIIKIQERLKALGYWSDVAFNVNFGPATEKAVKAFQQAKHLTVDGLIGKSTLKQLGFDFGGSTTQTDAKGSSTASNGKEKLQFDNTARQFEKVNVSAVYDETYRSLIDPSKMPAPQLTKAKLIDWKLAAEGGLSRNQNDSAASDPCPTPYKGVSGYHTNKGVTYKVWKKSFGTDNDERFLNMNHADWSTIFDKRYWDTNAISGYPDSINCLLVSFAWGGSKNPTVRGAESILGKSIDKANENDAVAALLSARGQLFINISQPGNKNNAFRKGWIDNALNKLVKQMYGG